jgi:hypothetical protein
MTAFQRLPASLCLLAGLFVAPAHAETYHTCGTVIASLPTVISTQGVYCLTHDLATSITAGKAIDIQTNNVTIDCNGYKIGGLAAGTDSNAYGIFADARQNITVRNCGIRGYYFGINLTGSGGAGHLVEDNRLDNNLLEGIVVNGDNNTVRRNRVYDTGGHTPATGFAYAVGIDASANVIDNTVSGVFGNLTDSSSTGINFNGKGTEARGNQVSGLMAAGSGTAIGILAAGTNGTIRDNSVADTDSSTGTGIFCNNDDLYTGNMIALFPTVMFSCHDGGGNASY